MALLKFIDSAFPPPAADLAGVDGFAFYIGGDTPHVWSRAEIDAAFHASASVKYGLPIYVRSNPQNVNPAVDAASAIQQLRYLGIPNKIMTALDYETAVDSQYMAAYVTALNDSGYLVIDYGSNSTIFANKNPDGYVWSADWNGIAALMPGSKMTQYQNAGVIDLDVADPTLPFWSPFAPPPPPTTPATQEEDMQLTKVAFVPFTRGQYKALYLYRDFNSPTNNTVVRVAIHSVANGYTVEHVNLNSALPVVVTFPHTDTNAVSLAIESGAEPVGYALA